MREPGPRFLIGAGKAEQLWERAKAADCDCIVFDTELSPSQQRNWEALTGLCVIDRHEVILDIFSDRPRRARPCSRWSWHGPNTRCRD
jgi:GTP-binding protein HflX